MTTMATVKSVCILKVLFWISFLNLSLIWNSRGSQAAIYRHTGVCTHNEKRYEAGQTFYRGCDKCYCHEGGYICFPPTKPTSWPRKCQRVSMPCGYRVVYRENPALDCRPYSWIW